MLLDPELLERLFSGAFATQGNVHTLLCFEPEYNSQRELTYLEQGKTRVWLDIVICISVIYVFVKFVFVFVKYA